MQTGSSTEMTETHCDDTQVLILKTWHLISLVQMSYLDLFSEEFSIPF